MLEFVKWQIICISIHTLRMEGDYPLRPLMPASNRFQSTPSAWRVTALEDFSVQLLAFQSTPSAWRVTESPASSASRAPISIHTLRVEGDCLGRRLAIHA